MSTKEPTKMTPPLTVEEIKRRRQDRLAAAVTPQGCGSGGWREHLASQPSDFPRQPCDLKKWLKYDSLPIERACFVLLGFEPPPLHVLIFVQDNYNPSREPTWEAPPEYNDVLESLRVSIAYGNVPIHKIRESQYETKQVSWPDLVRWARSKDYPIAPELETLVAKMEPATGNGTATVTAPVMVTSTPAPAQDTATPAPVATPGTAPVTQPSVQSAPGVTDGASSDVKPASNVPAWRLITPPVRTPGYRWPLYQFLQAAHVAGKPCPRAQHVLDAWKLTPPDNMKVIQLPTRDELEYEILSGKAKRATVKQIQAVIKDLLVE